MDISAAEHAAATAMRCDGGDAQAIAISGHVQSYLFKDHARAMSIFDRAILAGPNCALAWCLSSLTSGFLGNHEEAIRRAEHGLRLSPLAPDLWWYQIALAQGYYIAGRYDEAVLWGRKAFGNNDTHTGTMRTLIAALVAAGDVPAATVVAQRLIMVDPHFRLETFISRTPLGGELLERFAAGLRLAGLPP